MSSLTKQVQALMGREVVITHTVEMVYQGETNLKREEITQLPEPVEGWVMGLRWRQAGKASYYYEDSLSQFYPLRIGEFSIDYTIPVILVVPAANRNPLEAHVNAVYMRLGQYQSLGNDARSVVRFSDEEVVLDHKFLARRVLFSRHDLDT